MKCDVYVVPLFGNDMSQAICSDLFCSCVKFWGVFVYAEILSILVWPSDPAKDSDSEKNCLGGSILRICLDHDISRNKGTTMMAAT